MLDNLSDRLQSVFTTLRGKGKLSNEDIDIAMREIRRALLEADVNYKVVKDFVAKTKERCLDADVLDSLTPAQNVIRIVMDELTALLGEAQVPLVMAVKPPTTIMLVGLQGSGKTTAAAKLAYRLRADGHVPLLVACDVYRPAAADQLETLGGEIGVKVYRGDGVNPVAIATEGQRYAIDNLCDVVIIDTAGRLHLDEAMMNEAIAIRDATNPDDILMVVDAMTGQDVVTVVEAFAEAVDFTGVILSKLDGDARGGGALSIRAVTGKPILFVSTGEKPDALEPFYPDRMAKRILGMGDVLTLVENAVRIQQTEDLEEELEAERLAQGKLNLNDFIMMNRQVRKLGGIARIVSALPGGDKALGSGQVDEGALDAMEVIISSMTMQEREHPEILNGSRRSRIAAGAGVTVTDVNQVIKKFNETKKMMRKMISEGAVPQLNRSRKRKKGSKKRRRARPGLPGSAQMDLSKLKDLMDGAQER